MSFIRNLRIGQKLGLSFAVCLGLTLFVAIIGLGGIRNLQAEFNGLKEDQIPCVHVAQSIETDAIAYRLAVTDLAVGSDPAEEKAAAARMTQFSEAIGKDLKNYKAIASPGEDTDNFEKVQQTWTHYAMSRKRRRSSLS